MTRRFSIQFGLLAAGCVALSVFASLALLGVRLEALTEDLRATFAAAVDDAMRADGERLMSELADDVLPALLDYDQATLGRVTRSAAVGSPGVEVRIYDHHGRLLADSESGSVGLAAMARPELRGLDAPDEVLRWSDGDTLYAARPVCVGKACVGSVEVAMARAQIREAAQALDASFDAAQSSFLRRAALLCLAALLLIGLGAAAVGRMLGRRLQDSIDGAVGALDAMRTKAGEVDVSAIRDRELRELAASLSALAEQLADERARSQPIADSIADGLFVAQPGGKIVLANPPLHELVRALPESLLGGDAYELLDIPPATDAAAFAAAASDVTRLRKRRGGYRPVLVSAQVAGEAPDQKVVALVRDGTEMANAEARAEAAMVRAEAAEKARDEFLSVMSHELRTPLNGVLGGAAVLAGTDLTTAQRRFVNVVQDSGRSMLRMVSDVLEFSRLRSRTERVPLTAVDLDAVARDIADGAAAAARDKGLDFTVSVQSAMPMVLSDPDRLLQVGRILTDNAVKFTSEGRVDLAISAKVGADDAEVSITVADTGPGVAPDARERIFESFRQGDSSISRRKGGAGLGLALGREIAEALGGSLTVDSAPGGGAAFTLSFVADIHREFDDLTTPLTGVRALVVAEGSDERAALGERLAQAGADIASATTGAEALAMLRGAGRPDIVVHADVADLRESGLLRALHADDAARPLASIFLGAAPASDDPPPAHAVPAPARPTKSELIGAAKLALGASGFHERRAGLQPVPPAHVFQRGQPAEGGILRGEGGGGPMILLADDNEVNRIVLTGYLRKSGYDCCVAPNGYEAVRLFKELRPRVVLMSLDLPVMSGVEAARTMRRHERDAKIGETPIIGLIVEGKSGERERGAASGMTDYLSKPVKVETLTNKLGRWTQMADANEIAIDG